jgi:hypothetical protein
MSRFFSYFLIFLGIALIVPVLFQTIPDRKIAAVLAGGLFVFLPVLILLHHARTPKAEASMVRAVGAWKFAVLQFLMLFAVPIFFARVTHWEMEFRDVLIAGIPAPLIHRLSNVSFLIMLSATAGLVGLEFWNRKSKKGQSKRNSDPL